MLKNWFKIFLYNSLKNKLFFLLTIFGLATGMTGVILALSYWKDESAYNAWNPHKDNIHEVLVMFSDNKWSVQVAPLAYYLKEESDKVEDYLYFSYGYKNDPAIYNGKNVHLKNYSDVQANFFDFFPFEIVAGSDHAFKSTPNAMAIEQSQVFEIFGDEDPIGKTIQSPQGANYVITTVYVKNPASSMKPNFLIKEIESKVKQGIENNNWGDFNYGLLIKLKDPNDKIAIEKKLSDIVYDYRIKKEAVKQGKTEEELLKTSGRMTYELVSLADTRLSDSKSPTSLPEKKGNKTLLIINVGLSLLILIISIFNYINLSTAYAIKRAKEIGLRKVIGASKADIILQQIFETLIVTVIALVISLALVEILLPSYNLLLNKKLEINFIQYLPHFFGLAAVVILFAGIFPAMYIANFDILKVLKGNFSRSKSGTVLRNGMIILQFTIASFFIISGIVITKQVNYASSKDLGFNSNQIISIGWDKQLGDKKYDEYLRIKQDLLKIPGVTDVSTSAFTIGAGSASSSSYTLNEARVQAQNMVLDFNYLKLFDIKIAEGRDLDPQLASDTTKSVLINKTAEQAFGENQIIGKEIEAYGQKVKVVGIVNDFHLNGLDSKIPPMVFSHIKFTNWYQSNISTITVRIESDKMEAAIAQIEKYWNEHVDNTRPFIFEFIDKLFARTYQDYVNQRNLFGILNIVVISIALLGLFAIASYSIERRYKEIAIKKVLGIETGQLIGNLSGQYFILFLVGYVLAILPSYYLMSIWLENFAYRIELPMSAFFISFILMFLLTAIVVISKAYNATRISALTYLKYE